MIRINLLPHREIRRKQQQKEFFIMLGVVAGLGAAIWFATHSYLSGVLEEQNGRNTYLETEIATLDKQIEEIKKVQEQTAALLATQENCRIAAGEPRGNGLSARSTGAATAGRRVSEKRLSKKPTRLLSTDLPNRTRGFRLSCAIWSRRPILKTQPGRDHAVTDKSSRLSEFSLERIADARQRQTLPARNPRPSRRGAYPPTQSVAPVRTNRCRRASQGAKK